MTARTMRRVLAAAALAVAASTVSGQAGAGTSLADEICHFRQTPAGGLFYCVQRTPLSQGGCEVSVGSCEGGCDVNVGDCGPSGSCVVNTGECGDDSLINL